ncbi:hypothetical protein [Aliivibrio salmonicida]|uniref:hypothetical protein n=1 Tax=Aliivibrio salmonicida TaxID=40269 RepID=UPI003D107FCC
MKRLLLSTILITSSFSSFATEEIFESKRWKEITLDLSIEPYWADLDQICNEKYVGSRATNILDLLNFSETFKNENKRPQLYTFIRETFDFADSNDPQIRSAFKLNEGYQTMTLPFYFKDDYSYHNSSTLILISKNEKDEFVIHLPTLDATRSGPNLIILAPSLGRKKIFCIK